MYPHWQKAIETKKKMILDLTGEEAQKKHDCKHCECSIKGLELGLSKGNYHSRIKHNEHEKMTDTKYDMDKKSMASRVVDWIQSCRRSKNVPSFIEWSSGPFQLYCPVCEKEFITKKYNALLKTNNSKIAALAEKAKEYLFESWDVEKERKEIDPKYLKKIEKWAFAYWGRHN
jgi:hypothetical protein